MCPKSPHAPNKHACVRKKVIAKNKQMYTLEVIPLKQNVLRHMIQSYVIIMYCRRLNMLDVCRLLFVTYHVLFLNPLKLCT